MFADRYPFEQYQPEWWAGGEVSAGRRPCADRYSTVAEFCRRFDRPFTVLDVGANIGYFSFRLAEDFDCTVMAVESMYADWLCDLWDANEAERVLVCREHVTVATLRALADVEHFDVVLALSVTHHIDGDPPEVIDAIRRLGDHTLFEFATESTACNPAKVKATGPPDDATLLSTHDSHLGGSRSLWHAYTPRGTLARSYLGSPPEIGRPALWWEATFAERTVHHPGRDPRPWVRGVNLRTFRRYNGTRPTPHAIATMIADAYDPDHPHGDLQEWNVVLSGDSVTLIDSDDPHHSRTDDDLPALLAEVTDG